MTGLLIRYGYSILFFGVALEGEAFLLAASLMAYRGYMRLGVVILIAIVSNSAADQIYYILARRRGRPWMERRLGANRHYFRGLALMERHANLLLLLSRYAFGFRIVIPAACGVLGMSPLRFALINLAASVVWAVPVGLLGYYAGSAAERILGEAKIVELWLVLIVLTVIAVAFLIQRTRGKAWLGVWRRADLHSVAPLMIGLMGVLNLISAIFPREHPAMHRMEEWLPFEVTQRSRPLMLFAGIALLQVTRNLSRRKELAWYVAVVALSGSLLLHVTRALDVHHSLVAGLLLAYLLTFRRRFFARSDPALAKFAFAMAPILLGTVIVYGFVGFVSLQNQFTWQAGNTPWAEAFRSGILIVEPGLDPLTDHAARFLGSVQIAGWLARLYLLVLALRPVVLRSRQEIPRERLAEIFAGFGRDALSVFAIQGDKHHMFVAGGEGAIGYATRGSVALACGDPVAPEAKFDEAVGEFERFSRKNGWTPCFYEVSETNLPTYKSRGFRALKIAEDAVIELPEFSLSGGKMSNLRAMINKAAKSGLAVLRYDRATAEKPEFDDQLEEISEEWLGEKHLGEMGFTLGRFSLEGLDGVRVYIALVGDRVEAFCTWLAYRHGEAAALDLMRKRKEAPAGTMDFLIANSLLQMKAEGLREASLGNAPLANAGEPHGPLDRGVALLFERMNFLYGYKNLFQFKKKFAPRWLGRYLIYPKGTDIPKIAYAMTSVHVSGNLLWRLMGSGE